MNQTLVLLAILAIVAIAILISWARTRMPKESGGGSSVDVEPVPEEDTGINYAYERKNSLLTATEKKFFEALRYAVADQWYLFSKVRLEDIISVKNGLERKEAFGLRSRIKSRHIDFVLCDKETLAIELCIELDDWTHNRKSRRERDEFVDQALKAAGIPIEHVQVQDIYHKDYLRDVVLPKKDTSELKEA